MVVWWVSTVAMMILLDSNDAISIGMVPRIAITSMGLFFVFNLTLMIWPGVKKEYSNGTSLWQILMKASCWYWL